jgi:hypothetical protein
VRRLVLLAALALAGCAAPASAPVDPRLALAAACDEWSAYLQSAAVARRAGEVDDRDWTRLAVLRGEIGPLCEHQATAGYEALPRVRAAVGRLMAMEGAR